MLKALFLSFTLALAAMAMAQTSLVPNGSFEDTVNCEIPTQCTLLKAEHWYNPNLATPDVRDCDSTRWCGMPMGSNGGNNLSYQYSFDGDRHAGIYCWYGPGSSNTRDYLGVQLTQPMIGGAQYEVSLRYARRRNYTLAIDHMGVWFGMDSIWQATTWWLDVSPQLRLKDPASEYLDEGYEWTLLQDTLTASGGEQWMVIGHFEPAATVNGHVAEPEGFISLCYYFIDDVVVRPLETHIGIRTPQLTAYWGAHGLYLWAGGDLPEQVRIFDAAGRLLEEARIQPSEQVVEVAERPTGVYLLEFLWKDQRVVHKVMKE